MKTQYKRNLKRAVYYIPHVYTLVEITNDSNSPQEEAAVGYTDRDEVNSNNQSALKFEQKKKKSINRESLPIPSPGNKSESKSEQDKEKTVEPAKRFRIVTNQKEKKWVGRANQSTASDTNLEKFQKKLLTAMGPLSVLWKGLEYLKHSPDEAISIDQFYILPEKTMLLLRQTSNSISYQGRQNILSHLIKDSKNRNPCYGEKLRCFKSIIRKYLGKSSILSA